MSNKRKRLVKFEFELFEKLACTNKSQMKLETTYDYHLFCQIKFCLVNLADFCVCCIFQWMRHYSLSKIKLDLNSIVGSAECSHAKGKVSSVGQSIPAR